MADAAAHLVCHALSHTFGAHLAQKEISMAFIRDLLGYHSVTLTEKYYAHLAPNSLSAAVRQLEGRQVKKSLPNSSLDCTKSGNSVDENLQLATLLTHSSARCYVPQVPLLAGVAKLAYAADSKSMSCALCSLRNSLNPLDVVEENSLEALKPFAGIFEHFEGF